MAMAEARALRDLAENEERKSCGACHESLVRASFSNKQWRARTTQHRRCNQCVALGKNITHTPMPEPPSELNPTPNEVSEHLGTLTSAREPPSQARVRASRSQTTAIADQLRALAEGTPAQLRPTAVGPPSSRTSLERHLSSVCAPNGEAWRLALEVYTDTMLGDSQREKEESY